MILNLVRTLSTYIVPLITFPYVSHVLSASDLGRVDFSNSIVSNFLVLASFGTSAYGIRIVGQLRNDKSQLSKASQELFVLNAIFSMAATVGLSIFVMIDHKTQSNWAIFFLLAIPLFFNSMQMEWLYQGLEEYLYITKRTVVLQMISLVLVFVLVRRQGDAVPYAVTIAANQMFVIIANILGVKNRVNLKFVYKLELKKHIKGAFVIFLALLSGTIFQKLENILIGYLMNFQAVGFYYVANKIVLILSSVVIGVGLTFLPTIVEEFNSGRIERVREILQNTINFSMLIVVPVCLGLIVLSKEIIIFIAGQKYLSVEFSMQVMTLLVPLVSISVIYGNQVVLAAKKEKYSVIATIVGGSVGITSNLLLIPVLGVFGAALSVVISSTVSTVILYLVAYRYCKINLINISLMKFIFSSLLMAGAIEFGKSILDLNLFLWVLVGAVIYLGNLILFKDKTLKYGFSLVWRLVSRGGKMPA